ncbi:MAG: Maf family protein, partial [Proteobacteria bacterium]|nr:Maf family protein [Pseudomonadota bacterium]
IQGRGGVLVEKIKGSYSNVVGLPLAETVDEMLRYKVIQAR